MATVSVKPANTGDIGMFVIFDEPVKQMNSSLHPFTILKLKWILW